MMISSKLSIPWTSYAFRAFKEGEWKLLVLGGLLVILRRVFIHWRIGDTLVTLVTCEI